MPISRVKDGEKPFGTETWKEDMMLRKFFTTVAVGSLFVGGLAASHLAFAEDGAGPRGGRGGGMMMMADANKDGKITKAELTTALEARFARMDLNKDGKLDQADREAMRAQRQDARFAKLDTDKNGQISKAEFTVERGRPDGAEAGKPGGKRWGGGRHHRGPGFMRGEGMKDGAMTREEFMARPLAMFDKADANKDGAVTQDEMKAARTAMRGEWGGRKGERHMPPPPPAD